VTIFSSTNILLDVPGNFILLADIVDVFVQMSPAKPQLKPSKQHHPKFDVNNLLHCPHDTSHVDAVSDDDMTGESKCRHDGDI